MAELSKKSGSTLKQLDDTLDLYLVQKAPSLPTNIKELIVKISPWLTLIFLVLSLPAVLAVLGIGALFTPFSYLGGMNAGLQYTVSMVILAVTIVLEGLAIPGLFKRSISGWNFLFYSVLVSIISNIVSFNIGGLILGTIVPLYFLYQVKSYYK